MRFRSKMTLAILMLLSLLFGVGESILISVSFHSSLDTVKESAVSSYRAVLNTLLLVNGVSTQTGTEDVVKTLSELDGRGGALWSGVQLTSGAETLYAGGVPMPLAEVRDKAVSVSVFSYDGGEYAHVAGSLHMNGSVLCLDLCTDATPVYAVRDTQLSVYRWILAAVLILGAAVSWLISAMLTLPLARLSRASRDIAAGKLQSRANVKSGDEVEALARDFNAMAEKLEANIAELTDAMRRQEEFMGSFAHELKTPMTSIIGYADLLRSRSLNEDEQQEAANYIFSEGRRLESLSLKLLDLLVLRRQDFELREGSPAAVVTAVVRVMKPILEKQNITLRHRCENSLCMMEPDLIKSLLINLIDNARKAMEGGGAVFVMEKATETGCTIQVTDTGRGIPEEELLKITEAFYRVDKSRSRAQGGVGLGLALCTEIVKLHNGDIEFKSIVGKGTSVLVSLNGGAA